MKATYLAVSLTGPAQAVLGDLEPKARKNFAELTDALAARFGKENQQQVYRTALKTRSCQGDETLPELAQAVRRLTCQAYAEAPQWSCARGHFVDALSNIDMRWTVHQSWPQMLNDALTIAVELEAFMSTNRQQNRPARAVITGDNDVSSRGEHQGTAGAMTSVEDSAIKPLIPVRMNTSEGAEDGLYVDSVVEGLAVRFLVGTGASETMLKSSIYEELPEAKRIPLERTDAGRCQMEALSPLPAGESLR